jgi:hypothetical protein
VKPALIASDAAAVLSSSRFAKLISPPLLVQPEADTKKAIPHHFERMIHDGASGVQRRAAACSGVGKVGAGGGEKVLW